MHLEETAGKWKSISVRTQCDECPNIYQAKISTAAKQMEEVGHHQCRSCSSRRAGKKTGAKMSAVYSEKMKGDGNFAKRPEVRAKISAAKKGKPLSDANKKALRGVPKSNTENIKAAANRPEVREKHRKWMVAAMLNSDHPLNARFSKNFVTNKTPVPITCRSQLERIFLERVDDCLLIETVETAENLEIYYFLDGIKRRYMPDFKLTYTNGDVKIVEMKGTLYQKHSKYRNSSQAKAEALKEYCDRNGFGCVTLNEREYRAWLRAPEQSGV